MAPDGQTNLTLRGRASHGQLLAAHLKGVVVQWSHEDVGGRRVGVLLCDCLLPLAWNEL